MRIWHHFRSPADEVQCRSLLEGLNRAGVETVPYHHGAAPNVGLFLVRDFDSRCSDIIRSCSYAGMARVLVVILSPGQPTPGTAWDFLRAGAADVISWDGSPERIADVVARFERWEAVENILSSPVVRENLVGEGPVWKKVLRQVVEVARFTSASVLITGESGTGKELVARLIHTLDARPAKGNLVVLDCTTVVPELSGSEFFGHERGAYTGAVSPREGAFALANGGTLFLDEVGELPLTLQAELLRVIQEHTYKRVGSNTWQKTEFRLVCASNRPLHEEKAHGRFRPDLYYRIAGWTCHLPPLRERREDILLLADYFVGQLWTAGRPPEVSEPVRKYLTSRQYTGNIRELKQLISRMVFHHVGGGPITPGDIPEDQRPEPDGDEFAWRDKEFEQAIQRAVAMGATLRDIARFAEDTAVRAAVASEGGSLQRAANRLGVVDRTLQLKYAAWRREVLGGNRGKAEN